MYLYEYVVSSILRLPKPRLHWTRRLRLRAGRSLGLPVKRGPLGRRECFQIKLKRVTLAVAIFVVGVVAARSQSGDDAFQSRVKQLYDFHPHAVDDATREVKLKELDAFWENVKGRGEAGLSLLRTALVDPQAPAFFEYDGAKLLLSLSKRKEDKQIALAAIARTDVRDIQSDDYFFTVHELAVEGFDTTAAALKILSDSDFKVFVPAHVLTLGQDFCLIYLLLPLDESVYTQRAIRQLEIEPNEKAQRSLLLLLAYAVTPEADAAIESFAASESKPKSTRAYARELLAGLARMKASSSVGSISSLRKERRKVMARVSDEALDELNQLTRKIRKQAGGG